MFRKPSTWLIAAAWLMFIASMLLPVGQGDEAISGFVLALFAWYFWAPNLLMLAAPLVALVSSTRRMRLLPPIFAALLATLAIGMGYAVGLKLFPEDASLGYYLWLLSYVTMIGGFCIKAFETNHPRDTAAEPNSRDQ